MDAVTETNERTETRLFVHSLIRLLDGV